MIVLLYIAFALTMFLVNTYIENKNKIKNNGSTSKAVKERSRITRVN